MFILLSFLLILIRLSQVILYSNCSTSPLSLLIRVPATLQTFVLVLSDATIPKPSSTSTASSTPALYRTSKSSRARVRLASMSACLSKSSRTTSTMISGSSPAVLLMRKRFPTVIGYSNCSTVEVPFLIRVPETLHLFVFVASSAISNFSPRYSFISFISLALVLSGFQRTSRSSICVIRLSLSLIYAIISSTTTSMIISLSRLK